MVHAFGLVEERVLSANTWMQVPAWQVLLPKPCKLPNVNELCLMHNVIAENVRISELLIHISQPQPRIWQQTTYILKKVRPCDGVLIVAETPRT